MASERHIVAVLRPLTSTDLVESRRPGTTVCLLATLISYAAGIQEAEELWQHIHLVFHTGRRHRRRG